MATFANNSVANFFFSLAMATKMVAAWSAAFYTCISLLFLFFCWRRGQADIDSEISSLKHSTLE